MEKAYLLNVLLWFAVQPVLISVTVMSFLYIILVSVNVAWLLTFYKIDATSVYHTFFWNHVYLVSKI